MLTLESPAPDFALPDVVSGKICKLADFARSPVLLVAFICNHCPYVTHLRDPFVTLVRQYQSRGLGVVAICSNDVATHPDDSPEKMAHYARTHRFNFPYLHDETQAIAKAYHAACTPDFFVYNDQRRLVYRGQFDESRPGNGKRLTGADLRLGIESALNGRMMHGGSQKPSIGCNIKWKPGNEPAWFRHP